MTTIHVEPEQMREHGRNLLEQARQVEEQIQSLSSGLSRLEMSWYGGRAADFAAEIRAQIGQMQQHADQMNALGTRLIRNADTWLEIDQRGAGEFAGLTVNQGKPE